jgi:four helix bundle protein
MGQSYRQLIAWQKSMDFVMDVYKVTKALPRDELYGLATQLRRAAAAVPTTNIADGQARFSPNEFFYFLGRARGALVEVETQLLIAQNLNYFTAEQGQQLLDKAADVGKI